MKKYIKLLTPKLEGEAQEHFKKNIEPAIKFLLSKLSDLQLWVVFSFIFQVEWNIYKLNPPHDSLCFTFDSYVGESMADESALVFAYYKEGATDPTFLYLAPGLKEIKC